MAWVVFSNYPNISFQQLWCSFIILAYINIPAAFAENLSILMLTVKPITNAFDRDVPDVGI
jgi:hypothetical protein